MSTSSGFARKITRNTSKKIKNTQLTKFSEIDQLNKWSIPNVAIR